MSGKNNPMYGKYISEETRRKLSKANKGIRVSPDTEFRKGNIPWNKGLISREQPNWRGGISFEPYGLGFNNKLKGRIRKRDRFTCQECRMTEDELGYKLGIHHIDYNKENNSDDNLISLCRSCHTQTNFDRNNWTTYFKNKIG